MTPGPDARADLDFWATMTLVAGDFDGDDHADLAFVQSRLDGGPPHDGRVMLLLRDPQGHLDFRRARATAVGDDPGAVVSSDFDGDGRDDIATADEGSGTVSVVLTRPGAELAVQQRMVGQRPHAIAAADLDGDGLTDLAAACDDGTFVLYADAPGDFGPAVRLGQSADWLAAGRIDGDAAADVVLVPRSRDADAAFVVLLTDPASRGAVRERIEVGDIRGRGPLAIADLDGDGVSDVVRVAKHRGSGRVEIWLSDGAASPTFTLSQKLRVRGLPRWIDARDLDGDADTDLAVATSTTANLVLRTDVEPSAFVRNSARAWNGLPLNAALADFDDDGLPDLAAAGEGITIVRQYHARPGELRPATLVRPHR